MLLLDFIHKIKWTILKLTKFNYPFNNNMLTAFPHFMLFISDMVYIPQSQIEISMKLVHISDCKPTPKSEFNYIFVLNLLTFIRNLKPTPNIVRMLVFLSISWMIEFWHVCWTWEQLRELLNKHIFIPMLQIINNCF